MTMTTPTRPIFDLVTEMEDTIGRLHRYIHLAYVAIDDPVARGTVIDMSHELIAPVDQLMRDYDRLWHATQGGGAPTAPEATPDQTDPTDAEIARAAAMVPPHFRDAVLAAIRALARPAPVTEAA